MKAPCYRDSDIPVRRGDLVRWHSDEALSEVLFVVSTGDFPENLDQASRDWFRAEFGGGIMIKTPSAGDVLESEDCEAIELVRSARSDA
ncbi:MAG: hypothetical protein EON58_17620 [Alphaproteobacteria bacterium]|nr:MAG: hypothetical protein EON58_17620 [Alphaproteobacteria bacterium]